MPDVIKVDIEGFEPDFVRGALGVIRERRPMITLEVNRTTVTTAADHHAWQTMIDDLFGIYGDALWFGGTGQATRVTGLHLHDAPLRPCTLAFGERD